MASYTCSKLSAAMYTTTQRISFFKKKKKAKCIIPRIHGDEITNVNVEGGPGPVEGCAWL